MTIYTLFYSSSALNKKQEATGTADFITYPQIAYMCLSVRNPKYMSLHDVSGEDATGFGASLKQAKWCFMGGKVFSIKGTQVFYLIGDASNTGLA